MILVFLGLLSLTAFFNLAEMALVAARSSNLQAEGHQAGARVLALKRRPGLFLAAIRAGDLVIDLLTGAFVVTWLENVIRSGLTGRSALAPYAGTIGGIGAFAVTSYLVLVFGDLAPKSVALAGPERAAMRVALPLQWFILVARPCFVVLERSNALVLALFGVRPESEERVTQEEIRRTLSEGLSAGALLSFERSMMERVLDLEHRSVRSVMTGRRFVQSLPVDATVEQLRILALAAAVSRLVVTGGAGEQEVLGTVSRADLLAAITQDRTIDLRAMAVAPSYVAENSSVLSVLEILKHSQANMAVVVDEFGSLLGIVTFGDVLEAVAGDVVVAHPAPGVASSGPLRRADDGSYRMAGAQPIDDLVEELGFEVPAIRSYKTMAGFVIDRLRRVPVAGETLVVSGFRIEILEVERGTITLLRLIPETGDGR